MPLHRMASIRDTVAPECPPDYTIEPVAPVAAGSTRVSPRATRPAHEAAAPVPPLRRPALGST